MSQQQTVLRVQTNIPSLTLTGTTRYEYLDLYDDVPIKINKSFAELQDISKKNTDFSVNLSLPGSKTNNRFFESFYNVDVNSLYFFSNKKTACDVLINEESFFNGYMRLNKVNVLDSKVEYDVTLFSSVANLFGDIGNNLLKDLDFNDSEYTFNHTFNLYNAVEPYQDEETNFGLNQEAPYLYFYPLVHNGYEYSGSTLNVSGGTTNEQTRFYTSTGPISAWTSSGDMYAANVQHYKINTPGEGIYDNQLKPALSMWGLLKLIFKTYDYTITSNFMNTPWMKTLYMYGYFSSSATKFSYVINTIEFLPREGVELIYSGSTSYGTPLKVIICKRGTGIPCYCSETINYRFANMFPYTESGSIPTGVSGATFNAVYGFDFGIPTDDVPVADISTLKYLPRAVGSPVVFQEGDAVNFSLVVDQNIKQIDIISSIAKKFNLVFTPDPDNPKNILIEPYSYYIGTGEVHDWTSKLSYDKGFSVEPALNYIESNLIFTDSEDGDYGNKEFKDREKQVYGTQFFYGPTDFKSETGTTETIFSPEVLRQWDTADQPNNGGILLPLGINYVGSSTTEDVGGNSQTYYAYRGIKTKPKLFWFLGCHNLFLDTLGEVYQYNTGYNTYSISVKASDDVTGLSLLTAPIISHTMPMGMADNDKINNDSACLLFSSEFPVDIGVQTYNVYTENDAYNLFYENRINNLYDSNTRFVSGFFDLKYSDIINLHPKDIIKIQEQYFYVNKISEYNLVNQELTRVELVQTNSVPQTYPTRYFKYQYCDATGYTFAIATDFTNPNLRDTSFGWSVYYDQMIGTFTGSTAPSGFTASLRDVRTLTVNFIPFTISEITESEYNNSGYYNWTQDTMLEHVWNYVNPSFPNTVYAFGLGLPSFWINDAGTYTGLNLFTDCAEFNSTATTYGILTGSSIYYGPPIPPTPSPTPTITATTTVTPTPTITPTNTTTPTSTVTPSPTPVLVPGNLLFSKNNGIPSDINIQIDDSVLVGFANTTTFDGAVHYDTDGAVINSLTRGGPSNKYAPISDSIFTIEKYNSAQFIIGDGTQWTNTSNTINFPGYTTLVDGNFTNAVASFVLNNPSKKIRNSNNSLGFIAVGDTITNGLYSSNYGYFGTNLSAGYDFDFQSTGKLIVASSTGVRRINTNFTLDGTFTIYTGSTQGVAVDASDNIYIVGTGVTNKIVKLNSDGTVDTSFVVGSGLNQTTTSYDFKVAVTKDDKPIIVGPFDTYSGVTKNGIVKLNYNGSIDSSFTTGTGFNASPTKIDIDSLNNVWVGGVFTTYNGVSCGNIIKLFGGTAIPTPTPTSTTTPTVTPTITPTITLTPTISLTPTITPSPTRTATPTITPTKTVTPTPTITPTLPAFYRYVYLSGGTPSVNQFTLTNTTIVITECDAANKCYTFNGLINGSTIDIYSTNYYGRFTVSSTPTYSSGRYTITGAYVGTQPDQLSNDLYFSVVGATPTPTPTATITPTITLTPSITPTNTVTPSITPTNTITPTISITPTITNTATPTITPTISLTPSITPTISLTPSITPTISLTPTKTTTPTPTITTTPTATPNNALPTTIYVDGTSASYPGTGTTWTSLSSGTTYNATLYNSPTFTTGGTANYFTFNGTNQYADFGGSSAGSDSVPKSFGGWIKCATGAERVFFFRGEDGFGGWSMSIYNTATTNKFAFSTVSPGQYNAIGTTTNDGTSWYYVIGVWDRSTLKLYVNGVLEATVSSGTTLRSSTKGFQIARYNGPAYSNVTVGQFELYNYAITGTQIVNNFNSNKSQYGY